MTKFDWGDGKKVHSRKPTKRERQIASARRPASTGGGDTSDPYKIALRLATQAFAPAIAQAHRDVGAAQAHLAPGGALDQAYNASGASIADSIRAAGQVTQAAQTGAQQAGQLATGQAGAVADEQANYVAQQANLYGQTAKSAEAVRGEGARQVASLAGAAGSMSGYLGALGSIQANLGTSQTAANEGRRGLAREEVGRTLGKRQDALAALISKRGETASKTAADMAKDIRDFKLAQSTLNVNDANSVRDYLASLASITGQKTRQEDQQTFDAGEHAKDRGTKVDVANINAKGGGAKGAKGKDLVPYYSGPAGHVVNITRPQHAAVIQTHDAILGSRQAVSDALTDGKSTSRDEVRKRSGMKQGTAFNIAWEMAVNHKIPRRFLPWLKSKFINGQIPHDIWLLIEKK